MVEAMPEKKQTERNASVDVLRGIAILMVVLGHTMSGCTLNSQDTFLFRIIWSLQMPLFMLISGYVTKYSKPIVSGKALLRLLKKRSLAYLVPWLVWTIGVRGFLLGESNYLDIPWLLWHMDSGYWFLFSLWTITVIFATSQWAASKVHCEHGSIRYLITLVTCYGFGAAILLSLGVWQGLSFLCIKLTLYYMPFYFAGYLFGAYQKRITSMKNGAKWMEGIVALCCIAWLYLVIRFNFYTVEESVAMILLRMATSLLGCIAISGLCSSACAKINRGGGTLVRRTFVGELGGLSDAVSATDTIDAERTSSGIEYVRRNHRHSEYSLDMRDCLYSDKNNWMQHDSAKGLVCEGRIKAILSWFGVHSLEIYLLHGVLLNVLQVLPQISFDTAYGISLTFANYGMTLVLCYMVITLINLNQLLCKCLFFRWDGEWDAIRYQNTAR